MKISLEFIVQTFVILACLSIILQFGNEPVAAQLNCNGYPLIRDNSLPDDENALKASSWLPGTSALSPREVNVVIHDAGIYATAMGNGILDWNDKVDCAYVAFQTPSTSTNPTGVPPSNTLWVTFGTTSQGTQGFPTVNITNQQISFNIRMLGGYYSSPLNESANEWTRKLLRHETGHSFGLLNSSAASPGVTIMGATSGGYQQIYACDTDALKRIYCPSPTPTPTPTPTPSPSPSPSPTYCLGAYNFTTYPSTGCSAGFTVIGDVCNRSEYFVNQCNTHFGGYIEVSCDCNGGGCNEPSGGCPFPTYYIWNPDECMSSPIETPILIDVLGNGFNLTNYPNGVMFDLDRRGTAEQLSWTSINSDDSWLVLDRNENGTIDDGKEMFGNFTPQPDPPAGAEKNGFLALAVFDRPGKGGNNDGVISRRDDIFSRLLLWQDANHNGVSESNELRPLPDVGLRKIELTYQTSERVDQNGNRFKYRARVRDAQDAQLGRWAWDVLLVRAP